MLMGTEYLVAALAAVGLRCAIRMSDSSVCP